MWDQLAPAWRAAVEQAWEGYCAGSHPIGAAISGPTGQVLAVGRNRLREASAPGKQLAGVALAHAEINAILQLPVVSPLDPHCCILYTTTEPCPMCLGALVMANIRTVAFATRDPWAGGVADILQSTPYLRSKKVKFIPPQDVLLENVLIAIKTEWMFNPDGTPGFIAQLFPSFAPQGYHLGEQLWRSGELRAMAGEKCSAGQVVDRLAVMLDGSVKE
jgi:tRNA(adenine34) deaminase